MKICAIVVSYNRKELLVKCLKSLKNQSFKLSHIVVINNNSTDGTEEFLLENNYKNNENFSLINLKENQGGAGGFYEGINFAFKNNYEYIWLMDDDGIPEKNSLEELLKYSDKNSYLGCLVLDKENPKNLCFPMRLPNSLKVLENIDEVLNLKLNILENIVIPFNGILFHRDLVEKVGLPKKEYFIWGDDFEYTKRMEVNGVKIATIISAKFFHPKEKSLGSPMFFKKLYFNDTPSNLKLYCMCRNTVANHKKYSSKFKLLGFIFKALYFYIWTKPNFSKLKIAFRGIYHGLINDFSHHKEYS